MLTKRLASFFSGGGPDFSELRENECGVGKYSIGYKLPGSAINLNRRKEQFLSCVNLQSDLFNSYLQEDSNRQCVRVGFEWWAYRGAFFQGYFGLLGKLSMYIDVNRTNFESQVEQDNLQSLADYLKKDYWDYYEGDKGVNWESRQEFKDDIFTNGDTPSQYLVKLPDEYRVERINEIDWLTYSLVGEGTTGSHASYYWGYPISQNYYITVGFRARPELGEKSIRLERMLTDAKKIMSMVELRKE
ncbi:hypothetical protein ONV78_03740 [Hahella sp. CR1]|uniref:hypothetical protein n=1 Tax=Hahella sp. CR1 TaxID=2992807 RepID=UPI002442A683|nr:hypothetical protein [Hahella sp. CR1]MDG9666837.1 hypothetical protein [Hahella sp. CR1]